MDALFAYHPWIPLVAVVVFFAVLVGHSIVKGKKGAIPIDLDNPQADKKRPDVGSTDSRVRPRN